MNTTKPTPGPWKMTREYTGQNEMGSITPVCSCGWKGRAEYAYNDWQHTNVREQEEEHASAHRLANGATP